MHGTKKTIWVRSKPIFILLSNTFIWDRFKSQKTIKIGLWGVKWKIAIRWPSNAQLIILIKRKLSNELMLQISNKNKRVRQKKPCRHLLLRHLERFQKPQIYCRILANGRASFIKFLAKRNVTIKKAQKKNKKKINMQMLNL